METKHCRDCKWLCGKKTSVEIGRVNRIGIECMNRNRRLVRHGKVGVNRIKYPSTPACKTGFEPKEVENE